MMCVIVNALFESDPIAPRMRFAAPMKSISLDINKLAGGPKFADQDRRQVSPESSPAPIIVKRPNFFLD
jgi:hypothetical protein